jgi:hypothetical protein
MHATNITRSDISPTSLKVQVCITRRLFYFVCLYLFCACVGSAS